MKSPIWITVSAEHLGVAHTEVPEKLRHMGLASYPPETALQWARKHNPKVDFVRPTAQQYVANPEYSDLVMH